MEWKVWIKGTAEGKLFLEKAEQNNDEMIVLILWDEIQRNKNIL